MAAEKVDVRQLSLCVKPQVMVERMRPLQPPPPHCAWLWAMWSNNRALVKEERMPRSGGPLDSDLLIRQALSCLSMAAASGWDVSSACSRWREQPAESNTLRVLTDREQWPHHRSTQVTTSSYMQHNSQRMGIMQCCKGDCPLTSVFL